MNSYGIAMGLGLLFSALLIIYGIKDIRYPFIFKTEIKGKYLMKKEGHEIFIVNDQMVIMLDHPREALKLGEERTIYLDKSCQTGLLKPSAYFMSGLLRIGVGVFMALMFIVAFK